MEGSGSADFFFRFFLSGQWRELLFAGIDFFYTLNDLPGKFFCGAAVLTILVANFFYDPLFWQPFFMPPEHLIGRRFKSYPLVALSEPDNVFA